MSLALITLSGGAWIFLAFIVLFTIAVTVSLYSRAGSGVNQRPYGKMYSGAPGARGPSVLDHDRRAGWRNTRGSR